MELDKILKWDVTDKKFLVRQGFNYQKYYCGNYSCQKLYTWLRNQFKLLGVKFPFNPACFKHDRAYGTKPSMWQKIHIDKVFYNDMIILLNKNDSNYKKLLLRARFFYFMVCLLTPLYIFQGKIKDE
jgi:hypothetical protein